MDTEALSTRYLPFLRKYWLALALFLVGLIFFTYGLISFMGSASKPPDITFKSDSTKDNSASNAKSQNLIQVDVEGAVIAPGVYKLPANVIIKDALVSAKGLSQDADRDWVAKNINLAAKLSDGAKVYIPRLGDVAAQSVSSNGQALGDSQGMININQASSEALDSLPGVGPATATKIIGSRPYSDINQLLDKKVVSTKVFDQIKDKITVY